MQDFDKYLQRSKNIQQQAETQGNTMGFAIPWLMIAVGVIVTGFQTHSLSYRGMIGSAYYKDWVEFASGLTVFLLEGSAVGLTLGRLHFFKGESQRKLGHAASFGVWGVLAANTMVMFAVGGKETMPAMAQAWARVMLPLCIVGIALLWKFILDLHPDSQERVAILDSEAKHNAQWREIQAAQRQQVVDAYADAAQSEEVRIATAKLVRKAALKRAAQIAGAISESEGELTDGFKTAISDAD